MSDGPKAPPGWYNDRGTQRYWDGETWTDYTASNYWYLRNRATPPSEHLSSTGPHARAAEFRAMRSSRRWYAMWQVWVAAVFLGCSGLGLIGALADPQPTETITASSQDSASTPAPEDPPTKADPTPTPTTSPKPRPGKSKKAVVLLFLADQKDGDSWVASNGREYRLGLVNAPEVNEHCSIEASTFTRQFLASGFTVNDYSTDTYGRHVAEVFDKSGKSLNVALAKSGLGDGKYLDEFRHENPDLANRLEEAFASATTPSCKKTVAPVPFVQKPSPKPTYEPQESSGASGDDSAAGSGAHAVCRDGSLSYSQNRSGTCSHHGGVAKWLW